MFPAWCDRPARAPDEAARAAASRRQGELTKPAGSLGRLERLAIDLAALYGDPAPRVDPPHITVFAGDHGIAAAGVSAYPQSVTREMLRNFAAGGAAIAVLARHLDAALEVVDTGTAADDGPIAGVLAARVAAGTADFRHQPAMTRAELGQALATGREAVERARAGGARLFIGGEMGIANTTSAAAIACATCGWAPAALAGPGTGLDAAGVRHKTAVIAAGLARHADANSPQAALAAFGGFEIAALTGACLAAGQRGMPVVVDGFIASVAALVACRHQPALRPWLILAHRSPEPGHGRVVAALGGPAPLLDLDLRLGEGSGAAVAVPLLRAACALHAGMATFAEAGVARDR